MSAAAATPRVKSLCIGVDAYRHLERLQNAVSDARRMHRELEASGSSSSLLDNPTRQEMEQSLSALARDCRKSPPRLTLVFFAGHGKQLSNGEASMLPCDIPRLEESEECRRSMMTVADLWKTMSEAAHSDVKLPLL
eukprot:749495-Hanusia_phi.AAC.1